MNTIAILHFIEGLLVIALSVPLIRGWVKMNRWYGVTVSQAFASSDQWFAINRYGGRLLLRWGVLLAMFAACGMFSSKKWWGIYNYTALVITFGGLLLIVGLIFRYAKRTPNKTPEPTVGNDRGSA